MKLPDGLKPSKVLQGVSDRPGLDGALVRVEKKPGTRFSRLVLYATNSYVFLRAVLGPEGDGTEGPVPAVALRHMEKGVHFELGEKEIVAGITRYDRVMSEFTKDREPEKYVQDKFEELKPPQPKRAFRIGLNPLLLWELAQGMGAGKHDGISIEFDLDKLTEVEFGPKENHYSTYNKAMTVELIRDNETEGIIMPVRLNV